MPLQHPAVTSTVFELIQTFEFDMTLGEAFWPTRVELYRSESIPNLYRCRVWQCEHFRIQSTFSQKSADGPAHGSSDELILVDYSHYLTCDWNPAAFKASSPIEARELVEHALLAFLEHSSDVSSA